MRLLIASDFHGSEATWRKLLNAVRMDIWPADAVLVAGDLAGKALVPILPIEEGWGALIRGKPYLARTEEELARLDRTIADLGLYGELMTADERDELAADPTRLEDRFGHAIVRRLQSWLDLATERLAPKGVPIFVMPGNDDPYVVDDVLDTAEYAVNVDKRVARLPDGREIVGLAEVNPTPWDTPRELGEDELARVIQKVVANVEDPSSAIFMLHCPPHGSQIDTGPVLSENLQPVMTGTGEVLQQPVGSHAIRDALQHYQPLLGIHGHIHESPGVVRIGRTTCLNAGSEYNSGILHAYILEIDGDRIRPLRAEA